MHIQMGLLNNFPKYANRKYSTAYIFFDVVNHTTFQYILPLSLCHSCPFHQTEEHILPSADKTYNQVLFSIIHK